MGTISCNAFLSEQHYQRVRGVFICADSKGFCRLNLMGKHASLSEETSNAVGKISAHTCKGTKTNSSLQFGYPTI
jgi:hypothetical protein